jgi:hypothetical protein
MKNMISALFQSRPKMKGGTRNLITNGTFLGWKSIEDMYRANENWTAYTDSQVERE